MGFLAVLVAGIAGWMFGAAWYMTLSKQWTEVVGVEVGENGRPVNDGPMLYITSAIAMIIVAGMMRHTFATSGIDTMGKGFVTGLGVGLFFISPWIMINNAYGNRPMKLTIIDGGYATFGCAVIGLVLTLF
jgi:hypothetical protein